MSKTFGKDIYEEFKKFLEGKINGSIPKTTDDAMLDYVQINKFFEEMKAMPFFKNEGMNSEKDVVNWIYQYYSPNDSDPMYKALRAIGVKNYSEAVFKAMSNFESYKELLKSQDKEVHEIGSKAVEILQKKLSEHKQKIEGTFTSLLYNRAKMQRKDDTLRVIIEEIKDLGVRNPKDYKEELVKILESHLTENQRREKLGGELTLGGDTKKLITEIRNNLEKIPSPRISENEKGEKIKPN